MKILLVPALLLSTLTATPCLSADRTHQYPDAAGNQIEEAWWKTMAGCAGRTKVLSGWAASVKKAEAERINQWSDMFWVLAIHRLAADRAISEDEAAKLALEPAKSIAALQQQGIQIYTATGAMEQEYVGKINVCQQHLEAYSATFPEDFKKTQ